MPEIIEEIIVTPEDRPTLSEDSSGHGGFFTGFQSADTGTSFGGAPSGGLAFVPPAVVPVVEEIILTEKRLGALKAAKRAARFNVFSLGATLFGLIGAEALRQFSQRRLDELGELVTRTIPARPDTPVRTIEPEVIEEIIVTPEPALSPLVRPPTPQFFSWDDDPFIMQTVYPRVLEADVLPAVVTQPATIPSPSPLIAPIPAPLPLAMPAPAPAPGTLPAAFPIGFPFADPLPAISPQPAPQPSPVPTPTPFPSPTNLTGTQPSPLPLGYAGGCPPCPPPAKQKKCKDEKDKKRTKCYRQLVKQGRTARQDRVSKWALIDCETGRTLRELI